jgi:hypothetical protein
MAEWNEWHRHEAHAFLQGSERDARPLGRLRLPDARLHSVIILVAGARLGKGRSYADLIAATSQTAALACGRMGETAWQRLVSAAEVRGGAGSSTVWGWMRSIGSSG